MFSASVKSKEILNGWLTVVVTFTNGDQSFNEEFRTSAVTDDNWLTSAVSNRIWQLNGLYEAARSLQLGKMDVPEFVPASDPDHP